MKIFKFVWVISFSTSAKAIPPLSLFTRCQQTIVVRVASDYFIIKWSVNLASSFFFQSSRLAAELLFFHYDLQLLLMMSCSLLMTCPILFFISLKKNCSQFLNTSSFVTISVHFIFFSSLLPRHI